MKNSKMNKKRVNGWMKQIKDHMDAVAKERDRIDDTISELDELKSDCEEAYELLMRARDKLSELV